MVKRPLVLGTQSNPVSGGFPILEANSKGGVVDAGEIAIPHLRFGDLLWNLKLLRRQLQIGRQRRAIDGVQIFAI
jgi:hypothetical protein